MVHANTPLAEAERHFRACEELVARQLQLINELHVANQPDLAKSANRVLALLVDMLDTARRHLESERQRMADRAGKP